MPSIRMTVETTKSPDEVFAYLADFTNHQEWRGDVKSSTLESGTPGTSGAIWTQRVKQGPTTGTQRVELVDADAAARTLGFRSLDGGPVIATGTYVLEPTATGTRILADTTLEPKGAMKLMTPMVTMGMKKLNRSYTEQLTAALR